MKYKSQKKSYKFIKKDWFESCLQKKKTIKLSLSGHYQKKTIFIIRRKKKNIKFYFLYKIFCISCYTKLLILLLKNSNNNLFEIHSRERIKKEEKRRRREKGSACACETKTKIKTKKKKGRNFTFHFTSRTAHVARSEKTQKRGSNSFAKRSFSLYSQTPLHRQPPPSLQTRRARV